MTMNKRDRKTIEQIRDSLLEVCEINIDADWNWAEAKDKFNDMYDLIDLLFTNILENHGSAVQQLEEQL